MDWTKIHDAVWDSNEETPQKNSRLVVCNACGWIHFPISLEYCLQWEKDWAAADRVMDYRDHYLKCFNCSNSYKDFSPYIGKPTGLNHVFTIQPILDRIY